MNTKVYLALIGAASAITQEQSNSIGVRFVDSPSEEETVDQFQKIAESPISNEPVQQILAEAAA